MWTKSTEKRIHQEDPSTHRRDVLAKHIDDFNAERESGQDDHERDVNREQDSYQKYPTYISTAFDTYPY